MMKFIFKRLGLNVALLALACLPQITSAQVYFTDTTTGDVNAGFRKTGSHQESYEMVVYLGNITNILAVPGGTTINITNYSTKQLTNMCPDNFANLQWSVFSSFEGNAGGLNPPLTNSFGSFPAETCFYTVPRSSVNVQTTPVGRFPYSSEGNVQGLMLGVGVGANSTSSALGATNINNNTLVVLEPINFDPNYLLTTYIGDTYQGLGSAWGDFGGLVFAFTVENTTPSPFTSATVSDFYMNVPAGTGKKQFIDPFTGSTTGNADYLGYFTLNPNGSMTFTRAAAATAPSVGTVTATLTNGFAPLTAVFTNTATGTITNWVWNFGNGTIITNTTGGNVTNTYAASGNYTVTLTVYGPLGSSTSTQTSYIVASPAPKLGILPLNAGKLTLSGSNGPVGVQYRVLMATNLTQALATWTPVLTNTISSSGIYGYTNSWPTNKAAFYRLVSP